MICRIVLLAILIGNALGGSVLISRAAESVVIGSKAFAESWILGEALVRLVESGSEAEVTHKINLGGTEIVYQALRGGSIDIYPEYTGTITEVLMKGIAEATPAAMDTFLAEEGLGMTAPLGFNDSYALAVTAVTQERLRLFRISDLRDHPGLRLSLSHEFLGRQDGFPGLTDHYGLNMKSVRGIQHDLAYAAIANDQTDLIDIYTTDAQIERLGLEILDDDRSFFPRYDAVLLYRLDLEERAPEAFSAMQRLVGAIDEALMIRANGLVVLEKRSAADAADSLLGDLLDRQQATKARRSGLLRRVGRDSLVHLKLVSISLLAAVLIGIPLGILASRSKSLSAIVLAVAGLFQTIPSLALLAFLIPLLGIGPVPALVALFLYSLLPIVRNTYTGLATIPPNLSEAAEALGLPSTAQMRRVRIPMASPAIFAGIKTSAIINVGTATLAALIGAGGLGNPILQGIALRDNGRILQGAVPAAILALLVQYGFDLCDRLVIPRGLRLPTTPA